MDDAKSLLQKRKGLFFVLEGTDGSGTTTQCRLLSDALTDRGHQVICTREPGGTPIGERIRDLVLDNRYKEMSYITELLLYSAARAQHVNQKILPALEAGNIVICDRFTASTVAYQSHGRGIDLDIVEDANRISAGECRPDHTIYLSVSLDEALRRRAERREAIDRIECEGTDFQNRVINGFNQIGLQDSGSKSIIDASQNKVAVAQCIIDDVSKCWPNL